MTDFYPRGSFDDNERLRTQHTVIVVVVGILAGIAAVLIGWWW